MRIARLTEDIRTPVGSRLAVEWLARFEAMYAIWSPVSGVGADLSAARSTMHNVDREYEDEPEPDDPDIETDGRRLSSMTYVTSVFFHYTHARLALRAFKVRFGGLWLLPDSPAETDLRDAWHRIVLASPQTERDDSYMRMLLDEVEGREHNGFLDVVAGDQVGMASTTSGRSGQQAATASGRLATGEAENPSRHAATTRTSHRGARCTS